MNLQFKISAEQPMQVIGIFVSCCAGRLFSKNHRIRATEISLVCKAEIPPARTWQRFVFNPEIEEIIKSCIASYSLE